MSRGCLLPVQDLPFSKVCSFSTCKLYPSNTILEVRCSIAATIGYELISAKCIHNATSRSFEWMPPLINCTSVLSNVSAFHGSLYPLRQIEKALQLARLSAQNLREKPFVALSIGMSILSLTLVFIMIIGMCHRDPNDGMRARARHLTTRHRRRFPSDHQSVACQAERHHAPTPPQTTNERSTVFFDPNSPFQLTHGTNDGLIEGFRDSELLLSRSASTSQTEVNVNGFESSQTDPNNFSTSTYSTTLGLPQTAENRNVELERGRSNRVFKGIPALPSYKDAARTGMYCIVKDLQTPPPEYNRDWCPSGLSNSHIAHTHITSDLCRIFLSFSTKSLQHIHLIRITRLICESMVCPLGNNGLSVLT